MKLALKKLLQANPSIQVSTLLSGSLSTPSAKQAFIPPVYNLVQTITFDGSTSSGTFSNIPQTYENLEIRGQCNDIPYLLMRWNSATTTYYYDLNRIDGNTGSTMNTQTSDVAAVIGYVSNTTSNTTFRNTFTIMIPSYSRTLSRYHTGIAISGEATGGSSSQRTVSHFGRGQNAAISTIEIYSAQNFDAKSKFSLWVY